MRSFGLRSALVAAVCVWLQSSFAAAGPVERLVDVNASPTDPKFVALGYDNGGGGLVYTRDQGATFELLPVSAISPTLKQRGSTAITGDGKTLMGFFTGLWIDDGKGCNWTQVPEFQDVWVSDLDAHPTDPMITFAITSTGGIGDEPPQNYLYQRNASGAWTKLGGAQDLLLTSVRATKLSSGIRIYESGFRTPPVSPDGGVADSISVIRHSDDLGANWTEHMFDDPMGGKSILIQAVDPTDPDRIVLSAVRVGSVAIMVSSNRGQNFQDFVKLTDFGGVSFEPGGAIWLGEPASVSDPSASRGLWHAPNAMTAPTKLGTYGVQCVHYQSPAGPLYACQAWSFGTVDMASAAFTERTSFKTMPKFVTCSGVDVAGESKTQLCKDYCGLGHFATAPVCCAYNDPSCGPTAAAEENMGIRPECPPDTPGGSPLAGATGGGIAGSGAGASAAGGSGAGSASPTPVAGAGAAAGANAGGARSSTPSAGTGATPPAKSSSGGCSCSSFAARDQSSAGWAAAALLAFTIVQRSQRRRSPRKLSTRAALSL